MTNHLFGLILPWIFVVLVGSKVDVCLLLRRCITIESPILIGICFPGASKRFGERILGGSC